MRVVAGSLRGRTLHAPRHDRTRPTSDRVREALFSTLASRLGADVGGAEVLDAFAGSGALGIEALSRGAATATFVECDTAAFGALRRNISELDLASRARIVQGDIFRIVRADRLEGTAYSLLFLDPPYRIIKTEVTALLADLVARGAVVRDGLVVWEYGTGDPPEWSHGFVLEGSRRYGSTTIDIARWSGEGN